jgi:riboflavin kinase/FMN adenylyltransferase
MQIFRGIPTHTDTPIALTLGNFDGVHWGHQAMLKRLRKAATELKILAAVMTFEPHPREFFSPHNAPPRLTSLREKIRVFQEYGIERVYICHFNRHFADLSAQEFIKEYVDRLQVKWLLIGDDFRFGKDRTGDLKLLQQSAQQSGFTVEHMDSVLVNGKRVSSSLIREKLSDGNFRAVEDFLGRSYSMIGKVAHGKKIGRSLGFPTANILVKHNRAPFYGIFVVSVIGLGSHALQGVASLGVRPTLNENDRPILEVHIMNFDEQIYGRYIEVRFLKKLRDEEKYPDLKKLTDQIARDVENAKNYFLN